MTDHHTDKYGLQAVDKVGEWQDKAQKHQSHDDEDQEDDEQPPGGYDDTSVPNAAPGYTIRITFHRAENLPFSDFPSLSTDPYIHATFKTSLQKRHKQDPDLFLRTPTIHHNTDPKWETQWVIAHVPASGFFLKCRLYDEDPTDHDDRLGNVHVNVDNLWEEWPDIKNQAFDLKKRMGSKRAYTLRGIAAVLSKSVKMSGKVFISVENLGRSPGEGGGRAYTVAPLTWSRHHSPLIGRIAGTKARETGPDGTKGSAKYNFQAIQMQLRGPVPKEMYHRYVEFKPFVAGMFTDVSLRGRILNRALHHQHSRIYNYDSSTIYGVFEAPCIEMTKQFLEFCHYDQGGRIYTYVLSLDGLFRFTETGKEFGIDMLSKHTMHSDVSIYIAFSGEFFIRRLKHPHSHPHSRDASNESNTSVSSAPTEAFSEVAPPGAESSEQEEKGRHHHRLISKDPSYYELIIDNDSGTYRPNAKLLPRLQEFFEANFPGLRVATLDSQGDSEIMDKLKSEQRETKEHSGKQITYLQNSSESSFSSSDEEELARRADGEPNRSGYKKHMANWRDKSNRISDANSRELDEDDPENYKNEEIGTKNPTPGSDDDSRDYSSDNSEYRPVSSRLPTERHDIAEQNGADQAERKVSGYDNKEIANLLKKDENGEIPRPQADEGGKQTGGDESGYANLETGSDKPAGGIVYGAVVSTADVERDAPTKKQKKERKRDGKKLHRNFLSLRKKEKNKDDGER